MRESPNPLRENGRVKRRLKLVALLGLAWAALIFGAGVIAALEVRPLSAPALAVVVVAVATLLTSAHVLLPSSQTGSTRRLAALQGLSGEARRIYLARVISRQRVALTLAVLFEIPVAFLFWSYATWQPWIVAVVGTTVLFVALTSIILRRLRSATTP